MRKSDAIPTKYFRAKDLPDGWTLTAEVEMARMEKFEGDRGKGDSDKMVVYFRRQKSGLVVGSVVWDMFIDVTGEEDSDHWKGHVVELYKTTTPFGRETVPCVRVRKASEPPKKAKKPVVHHDDDADADDFRDSAND
jgi:hypothetical protein